MGREVAKQRRLTEFRKVEGKRAYVDLIYGQLLREGDVAAMLPTLIMPIGDFYNSMQCLQISQEDAAAIVVRRK